MCPCLFGPPLSLLLACYSHPEPHGLQVYPRTFLGEASMYEKGWWQLLVRGWEAVVYNPGAPGAGGVQLGWAGPPGLPPGHAAS